MIFRHTLTVLILALLFSTFVPADERPVKTGLQLVDAAAMADLSFSKQPAVIELTLATGAKAGQPFYGAFISNDGLALVDLSALAWEGPPVVTTDDGTKLEFGTILGMFPEPELALMKFAYRPKVWMELSDEEPAMGAPLAVVFAPQVDGNRKINTPPVVGPLMARRIIQTSSNLKNTSFHTILSLGAGLSTRQRVGLAPGIFAIDAKGAIVAVSGGIDTVAGQLLVILPSLTHLPAEINRLAKTPEAMPRAEAKKFIDTTLVDNDFRKLHQATRERDDAKTRLHLTTLLKKYPKHPSLRQTAIMLDLRDDQGAPFFKLEDYQPDPESSPAEQVEVLMTRMQVFAAKQELQPAIEAARQAIKLSPESFPAPYLALATLHATSGNPDKAVPLLEKIEPFMMDSIGVAEGLASLLNQAGRWAEADKRSERVYELEKIYRR